MLFRSTSAISLKANWTRNKKTLTINPSGGVYDGKTTNTTVEVDEGSQYQLQIPTKENFTFGGWDTNPSSSYNSTTRELTIGTSDITITAKWNNIKRTLTIDANGGIYEDNKSIVTMEVNQGEEYSLKTPTKGGFDFDGWTSEPAGVYNSSTGKITIPASDVTLYAKWKNKVCPSTPTCTQALWNRQKH